MHAEDKKHSAPAKIPSTQIANVSGSTNNCGFNCAGQAMIDYLYTPISEGAAPKSDFKRLYDAEAKLAPGQQPIHDLIHSFARYFNMGQMSWDTFEELFLSVHYLDDLQRQFIWGDVLRYHLKQVQTNTADPVYAPYKQKYDAFIDRRAQQLRDFQISEKEIKRERQSYLRMGNPEVPADTVILNFFYNEVLNIQYCSAAHKPMERTGLNRFDTIYQNQLLAGKIPAELTLSNDDNVAAPAQPFFKLHLVNFRGAVNHWVFHAPSVRIARHNTEQVRGWRGYFSRWLGISKEQKMGDLVQRVQGLTNYGALKALGDQLKNKYWSWWNIFGDGESQRKEMYYAAMKVLRYAQTAEEVKNIKELVESYDFMHRDIPMNYEARYTQNNQQGTRLLIEVPRYKPPGEAWRGKNVQYTQISHFGYSGEGTSAEMYGIYQATKTKFDSLLLELPEGETDLFSSAAGPRSATGLSTVPPSAIGGERKERKREVIDEPPCYPPDFIRQQREALQSIESNRRAPSVPVGQARGGFTASGASERKERKTRESGDLSAASSLSSSYSQTVLGSRDPRAASVSTASSSLGGRRSVSHSSSSSLSQDSQLAPDEQDQGIGVGRFDL